jgi:type IV secretory pathway VirB2 component (pilin)
MLRRLVLGFGVLVADLGVFLLLCIVEGVVIDLVASGLSSWLSCAQGRFFGVGGQDLGGP